MNLRRVTRQLVDIRAAEADVEMRSLLASAGQGDQRAWDAIVRQFTNLLWSIARADRLDPVDASDAVQMTWCPTGQRPRVESRGCPTEARDPASGAVSGQPGRVTRIG
jgi:hypothetical protein